MSDNEEIKKVRESEERRGVGRNPKIDSELTERAKRRRNSLRTILWAESTMVEDVEDAMIGQGISPDSEQWNALLEMWRDERRKKRLPI